MKERNAAFMLALAAFIWGMAFIFQSQAAGVMGPFIYNGIRMLIGSAVLVPFLVRILRRHKGDSVYRKNLLQGSLVCGLIIAAASAVQQYGIGLTTAGKAGFITSLYSLFVPVFSIIVGKKVSGRTWICVGVGLAGAFLLSYSGGSLNKGDVIIFICAVLFAFQIMAVDKYAQYVEGIDLSCLQFLVGGVLSLVVGLFTETVSFEMIKKAAVSILYVGIFSSGVAYTLQIVGQKYIQPAKATLVLCLESAWAALGGLVFLHETMSFREVCGCVLLFAAVVVSQLPGRNERGT